MDRRHDSIASRSRLMIGVALMAAAAFAPAAAAQGANQGTTAAPATLQESRKAWAAAVLRSDGAAAAALAVLPLQYEGYQAPKTVGRAHYLREVPNWSTLGNCLANEPVTPVRPRSRLGTHSFNCDGHGFFFAQKNSVWRHTGYENSNE